MPSPAPKHAAARHAARRQQRSRRRIAPAMLLGACGIAAVAFAGPTSLAADRSIDDSAPATSAAVAPFDSTLLPLHRPLALALVQPAVPVAKPAVPVARPAAKRASRSRHAAAPVGYVRPTDAVITSLFGMRWGRLHKGIDFGASFGTPIHVVTGGVVVGAGFGIESGYGNLVLVRHANGIVTAYAHMSKILVSTGEHVSTGEVLGLVGSTGHSTGPHLHFEVRVGSGVINPIPWLRLHGVDV